MGVTIPFIRDKWQEAVKLQFGIAEIIRTAQNIKHVSVSSETKLRR